MSSGLFDDVLEPEAGAAPPSSSPPSAAPPSSGLFDDVLEAPPSPNQGVVLPSIKRTAGQFVESVGTTIEDITGENAVTRGLQDFGGGVVKANPSQINSVGDILENPWTTIKEAVAEQVPQLGAAFTGARLGAMAGAPLGPVGAAGGALIGGLAPIAIQEYGEIRGKQKETGEENIPLAIGGAGVATALERFGLEKLATKAGAKGFGEVLDAIPEGTSRLAHAGKQGLKTALVEGPGTEIPQTVIERYAGGQEIGTAEALDEYALAGAKGAIGGGVIGGGLGLVAPREQAQPAKVDDRTLTPGAAAPAAQAPGAETTDEVGLQDLDPAAQRHMGDILQGGPPLGPTPPPAGAGPLGRAAAAGGIPGVAPGPQPTATVATVATEGRKRGPLSPLGADLAAQGKAEVAAEQARLAGISEISDTPAQPTATLQHPPDIANSSKTEPKPDPNRFHKLNTARTEPKARQFAEGLAGKFPDHTFEVVPHRLTKGKFAVKASQRPPASQAQAAHQAATSPLNDLPEPTEPQKEAGNYQKGHVRYAGLDISVENPTGSKRSGVGPDGTPWEVEMSAHYGYVRRTNGNDGEQVDVYLASEREDTPAFVVDQIDPKTGKFDEHKAVLGAASREEAEAIYDAHFSDQSGPVRRQAVTELPMEGFKAWLKSGNTKQPIGVQAPPPTATIDAPQPAALPEERGVDASRATETELQPQPQPAGLSEGPDSGSPGVTEPAAEFPGSDNAGLLPASAAAEADTDDQAALAGVDAQDEATDRGGPDLPRLPGVAPVFLPRDGQDGDEQGREGEAQEGPRDGADLLAATKPNPATAGPTPGIPPAQSLAQGEIAPPGASPAIDSSPKAENATTPVDPGKDADSGLLSNKQAVDSPEDAAQEVTPAPSSHQTRSQPGAKATVKTASGRSAEVHYALVEANDLVVSNDEAGQINPDYPKALQPRDRSRVAMQAQVAAMAGSLDPARLGDSQLASQGAPIMGPDGVVESGNGRSMAISRAYREGKAEPYRRYLEENAERFGIDRAAIQGMRAPVLVRQRTSTFDDTERLAFVREANQTDVAAMSPVEQAFADAARLDAEAFATYRPSEDGDILARSNDASRAIFLKGLSSEERNALMTADGRATKQLVDRIQAAVFARAYGDERLLGLLAEEADPDIKNIVNALNAAAAAFVRARSLNEQLTPYNIIPALVEGADFVRETRRTGQAVQEAIAQQDLFGGRDPNALALAMFMDANKRSPRRLGEGFRAMAEFIEKELVRAQNQNLFAETPPTLGQVIARVNDFMKERYGQEDAIQPDLFSKPERSEPIAQARPESRKPEEGAGAGAQGAEAAEEVKPAEKKPFKAHIAELRQKRQKLEAKIRAYYERDGSVYAVSEKDPTLAILLTDSTMKEGEFRVTTLRDGEPTGHRDYKHLSVGIDSAASEFASSDFKIGPAPGGIKPAAPTEADVDAMLARDMAAKEEEDNRFGRIDHMVVEKAKRELAAGRITQAQYDNVIKNNGAAAAQYASSKAPSKEEAKPEAKPPKPKRRVAKAPPPKDELKDVGEKIEGARKDLWAGRALGHQDIAGMNERELQKFVTKEHVFPRPDYQALADHINAEFGDRFDAAKQRFSEDVRVLDMGAGSALLIKKIRDSIENPPLGASREQLEDYLTAIGMVRKALEDLQNFVVPTGSNLVKLAFGDDITAGTTRYWNHESPNWKYLDALGNKFARIAQVDSRDWAKAIMEADKTGFPKKQEVWQREYRIFPKGDLKIGKGAKYIEGKPVDVFFVGAHEARFLRNFPTQAEAEIAIAAYTPYLVIAKKSGNLVKQVDTEAEGINFARDTYKAQHPTVKREDKTPELRHIVREGQDYRGGRDIGDNELKDAFGFRGVQFGNWTDQRDRQQSLNHAYDALMDLADALGIPPQALSLNGELGMAFGARGSGRHAAHYEPTQVVINLTKTSGAGSTAHEWAHALDDYFGRLSGDLKGKKSPFASHGVSAKSGMRPEMVQAFKNVMSAINNRLQTNEEVLKAAQADIEKSAKYIASWLKGLREELKDAERDGSGFDALASAIQDSAGDARAETDVLFGYMRDKNGKLPSKERRNGLTRNLDWRRRYYQRLNKAMSGEATPMKLTSTYSALSTAKGPYWARAHELFARAFESFMLDKLAGQGRRSDYLVHPAQQDRGATDPDYPYPAGSERTNINAAFEKFVGAIAHKETEKGTALYSRAYHGSPHKFDRFDVSKIGTGEGAQAYGHGLYFAENPEVAREYQKVLTSTIPGWHTGGSKYQVEGVAFPKGRSGHMALDTGQDIESLLSYRKGGYKDMEEVVKNNIERRIQRFEESPPGQGSAYDDMKALADFYKAHAREAPASSIRENRGALYQVDIPDEHIEKMLDWDRPLSEQAPWVQSALIGDNKIRAEVERQQPAYIQRSQGRFADKKYEKGMNAGQLISHLRDVYGGDKEASAALRSLGIPGIKYLDQGSRGGPDTPKTRNFVVFDDKIVTIIDRNGEKLAGSEKQEAIGELQAQHPETNPDIRYSYLGERAEKAPRLALATARELDAQGISMEEIRKSTGWFKAKDDKWRFEISDKDARLKLDWDGYGNTIGDTIAHPTLFENYPSLAKIEVVYRFDLPANVAGGYDPETNTIHLSVELGPQSTLSTLLHELQHVVQFTEGFAIGGSPDDEAFISAAAAMGIDVNDREALVSVYRRLLGEVEARDVQARSKLTAKELRERPPYVSQGIPESAFVVRYEGGLAASQETQKPGPAGLSVSRVRETLAKRFGAGVGRLIQAGTLRIVQHDSELPAHLNDGQGGIRGVYDTQNDTTWLVADNLSIKDAPGVFLHEVGAHFGLERMIGSDKYEEIIRQMRVMEMAGDKAVRAARAAIPEGTPSLAVNDELIAYLVEKHPELPLVKRIIAAIRAFLFRQGLIKNIRPEDVVALAKAAVRHAARGPVMNRADSVESLAPAYSGSPLWYSEMAKFIDSKGPGKAPGAEWKKLLEGWAKQGKFKGEELEWSGVKEWLDLQQGRTDPISKYMLGPFIRQQGVRVEETHLGGAGKTPAVDVRETDNGWEVYDLDTGNALSMHRNRGDALDASAEIDMSGDMGTKFAQWQLPGGENYREVLLRLPEKHPADLWKVVASADNAGEFDVVDGGGRVRYSTRDRADAQQYIADNREIIRPDNDERNFRSSHFDEPNILAHVRFNERVDADGKRVLFIEEIQSDWAQKGKAKGFFGPKEKAELAALRYKAGGAALTEAEDKRVLTLAAAEVVGAPVAPFVQKTEAWVGLALKRMIRHAAANGFDRIAWTTGEQQAERYDLSKQVREIHVRRIPEGASRGTPGNYTLGIVLPGGDHYQEGKTANVPEKSLEDLVGKDLATKIVKESKTSDHEWTTFKGEDLKVGGSGMRTFYNQIVPNVANALLKKLGGGRVSVTDLPAPVLPGIPTFTVIDQNGHQRGAFRSREEAQRYLDTRPSFVDPARSEIRDVSLPQIESKTGPTSQPGFDITPALRESAMRGLPLFSRQGITDLIKRALSSPRSADRLVIAPVSEDLAKEVSKEIGVDISHYEHTLDAFAVRHIFSEHGDPTKERARGQIEITPADLEAIPEIIETADKTIYGAKNRLRHDLIGYLKRMPDGSSLYFEEIRTGRRTLAGTSMRKYPATIDAQAIIASVNLNAQSDGEILRVVDHAKNKSPGLAPSGPVKGPQGPLFSRAPDPGTPEGSAAAVDRIGEAMRTTRHGWDIIKSKMLKDWRPAWLGIFTRRQLVDVGEAMVPALASYNRAAEAMDADRNQFDDEAHVVAEAAAAYVKGHKKEADELFDLMHAATLSGVDPAQDNKPSIFRQEAHKEIASLRRRMRSRPGEADVLQAQIDQIRIRLDNEKVRKQAYPALERRYAGLSEDARGVYAQMRDLYSKRFDEREAALIERIKDAEADERWKSRLIADLRLRFETARLLAPYFPLTRFGDYWVASVNPDGEKEFHLRESEHQQQALIAELEAGGSRAIRHGFKMDTLFEQQGVSAGFVSQIIRVLDNKKGPRSSPAIEGIKDEIYQIYLHSMPELSTRRHWIHRQKTPGFSKDALRGFAKQMFHGNRQLARLRQQSDMEKALSTMRKQAREATDPNRAAHLVNEMQKRDAWIKNPTTASWANAAGGLGFLWYLTAPASAIVNVTQTPLVAYPLLAARHGWGAAAKALTGAMGDYFKGRFSVEGALKGDDLAAYRRFLADGLIDKTQSHDLAGQYETPSAIYSGRTAKVMRAASFLFHRAERANREITALAAFRLARAKGLDLNAAYAEAKALTWESHFDYSNANKARFIQKDAARVLFMFKQFSQHMTYLLARSAHQSLKGLTPGARLEARVRLTGILGMHALFAGALGMPLMGTLAFVMNALFDDEDEPYDFELEFRNFLAGAFGDEIGQAIVRGPVESLTGLGVAHRVGLSDLWFREPDKTLEGRGLVEYWAEQFLGPLGGIALKAGTAYEMFQDGKTARALESMTPAPIRSGLQMLRYAGEGVQNLRGDPIMENVSAWNLLSQAAGFSPAELGQKYDANRAIKNLENRILGRRERLIDRWWLARRTGDMEGVREAMAEIRKFNESTSIRQNPRARITPATLLASTQARRNYSRRAEGGIIVDQRLARLPEQVRFAP